ncbi:shikimate kinase [Nonlabens sp.]|uniref:shikimate kinase n=1 Tax=Nonlabens sp. TaxID=1888209 RepID=UPI003F6A1E4D
MLVFIGYMGSGKSVVGQRVSELLGHRFIDLDHFIEQEEKMSIPEIFSKKGPIYFRKRENECLKSIIEGDQKVVLSLGGGTPCYYNNMELLSTKSFIQSYYLEASIDSLVERLWDNRMNRPLISGIKKREDLEEFIAKHLFERRPFYLSATKKINVNHKTVEQIAQNAISGLF